MYDIFEALGFRTTNYRFVAIKGEVLKEFYYKISSATKFFVY